MVRPRKAVNYLKIGNWSIFVLFGWRSVFGIITGWEGPFRCHATVGLIKLLLSYF